MHSLKETTAIRAGQKFSLPATMLVLGLFLFCASGEAGDNKPASDGSSGWKIHEWKVQTSLYTRHWDSDPNHVNHQKLLGLEAVCENDWLFGAAVFDNSFGQNTQFLYTGKSWQLFGSGFWYFKLVGGLLHGYKGAYKDKIPLNGLGIAPALVPALGLRYRKVFVEANLAGTAAVTITAGIAF